ncbi:MAG: hypothetical protein K8L99_31025, partial [Anaerolineae bacterium]|nr:hypothetical protein [Anaerolineae bacterium]
LWLRIASAGYPFNYIDEPLMNYRVHSNSMTAQIRPEQSKSWVAQLDKFFSDPQLATQIQELKAEAYAILHYETAGRFYRAGHLELAIQHLSDAMRANPQVDENWLLEWIAGTALDPRTANPDQFVNWAVASLKAQGLGLSRRAQGRYHIASAFEAYRLHHYPQIRAQLLPALTSDPSVAFNRGFIRIALEALVRK